MQLLPESEFILQLLDVLQSGERHEVVLNRQLMSCFCLTPLIQGSSDGGLSPFFFFAVSVCDASRRSSGICRDAPIPASRRELSLLGVPAPFTMRCFPTTTPWRACSLCSRRSQRPPSGRQRHLLLSQRCRTGDDGQACPRDAGREGGSLVVSCGTERHTSVPRTRPSCTALNRRHRPGQSEVTVARCEGRRSRDCLELLSHSGRVGIP